MKYMEMLFATNQERLEEVYNAYRKTKQGERDPLRPSAFQSYENFQTIPLMQASILARSPYNVTFNSKDCSKFNTSGSTNRSKSIYIPNPVRAAPLPQPWDQLVSTTSSIFIHGSLDPLNIHDSFTQSHINIYSELYPGKEFTGFCDEYSVSKILGKFETLIFFSYPTAFTRFIYLAENAVEKGMITRNAIVTHNIYAKLTGESVSVKMVSNWRERVHNLLGFFPEVSIRYGATEVQEIGVCDWDESKIGIEYETTHRNCFVEILEPKTLTPIEAGEGLVIVTSFRTSGTIIIRYPLGDLVFSRIENGKRYLSSINRENYFNIAGNSLSIQYLANQISNKFGNSIRLNAYHHIDRYTGLESVIISVFYVIGEVTTSPHEIEAYIRKLLITTLPIGSKIRDGMVLLKIDAKGVIKTDWRHKKKWALEEKA